MGVCGHRHPSAAFPPGKRPRAHCRGSLMDLRGGLDGCRKSVLHRDRFPDHAVRGESLYRLTYPGPHWYHVHKILRFHFLVCIWSHILSFSLNGIVANKRTYLNTKIGEVVPVHTERVYRGSNVIPPLILNFGARWRCGQLYAAASLFSGLRYPCIVGRAGPENRSGCFGDEKSFAPAGVWTSQRPALKLF
jgi:hypothetical protein